MAEIYRLETSEGWSLELVDQEWNSTVWEELFATDQAAWDEFQREVRSHDVPFILEDGQVIGRLAYEKMAEPPGTLYGQTRTSNYQGQGLKLSKHFRT
jgi:hypothetical protein